MEIQYRKNENWECVIIKVPHADLGFYGKKISAAIDRFYMHEGIPKPDVIDIIDFTILKRNEDDDTVVVNYAVVK